MRAATFCVLLAGTQLLAQTDPANPRPGNRPQEPIPAKQDPVPAKPAPMAKAADHAFLDDVLGAKVSMAPGAEARREAAEDNESAKRPSGELQDLLVNRSSGRADIAIVSVGGFLGIGDKNVALPVHMLRWNGEKKHFDLSATEDQLKALPAIDLKDATKRGLDQEVTAIRGHWSKAGLPEHRAGVEHRAGEIADKTKAAVEDAADKARRAAQGETAEAAAQRPDATKGTIKGTTFTPATVHTACASDLDDPEVYALSEKFGKVTKCVVDRNTWDIPFCVVSHGGALGVGNTEYLVPFRALTACRKGNDDILCLDRSVDQLKGGAVKYEKPKNGVVDPSAAERANSAYGTDYSRRSD